MTPASVSSGIPQESGWSETRDTTIPKSRTVLYRIEQRSERTIDGHKRNKKESRATQLNRKDGEERT